MHIPFNHAGGFDCNAKNGKKTYFLIRFRLTNYMAFFEQAITVPQTLVIALGAGLGIWGVISLSYLSTKTR